MARIEVSRRDENGDRIAVIHSYASGDGELSFVAQDPQTTVCVTPAPTLEECKAVMQGRDDWEVYTFAPNFYKARRKTTDPAEANRRITAFGHSPMTPDGRELIGNTPTYEDCDSPLEDCTCEGTLQECRATETKSFIDITPRGCQTPEGIQRVNQAQNEWDDATHLLANAVKEILDSGVELFSNNKLDREAMHQIGALIGARDRKQNAFLKAVSGR